MTEHLQRLHLRVSGVVQGVGFRPFVYRLAQQHHLTGFVGNDSQGVFIEIEGNASDLIAFQNDLLSEAPPLAHIEKVTVNTLNVQGDAVFSIVPSVHQENIATLVSPDLCICEDCLKELFDPHNRRYRYPFINCTNCGPRFTIIQALPYDRPQTTMAAFSLCESCAKEYHDPLDRRFHAQPIACPDCGPQVMYLAEQKQSMGDSAIEAARQTLLAGKILAIKGLGGFHLACDATNEAVITRLRERKRRYEKPLAIMVYDLHMAHQMAVIDDSSATLLSNPARPIVLVQKHADSPLAENIAFSNPYVGLFLPYTPLHYLVLHDLGIPVVMTSGNLTNEPIVIQNDEALKCLAPLADAFLLHNREIHVPCDDSVIRVMDAKEIPIRRSRGYAPFPVKLPFEVKPAIAVGGELKNTFCLAHGKEAFMSQHIGDMENLETLTAFEKASIHMKTLFQVQPEQVICDLHPAYLSTRWAKEYSQQMEIPLIQVQHHHAHIAAVMGEHKKGANESVIGICFDGTGYGTDTAIWGGEILVANYAGFERIAHLAYTPLVGGEVSIRKPYRMALAYLHAAGIPWKNDLPCVQVCSHIEQNILHQQLTTGFNSVPTSSMGRLFDAIASLIGLRHEVSYEAQAAMELESIAENPTQTPYHFAFDGTIIDPTPLLYNIVHDLRAGKSQALISGWFHQALVKLIVTVAQEIQGETGLKTVALSGGVFQNILLLNLAYSALQAQGFEVLIHHQVPANDGGLALGQILLGQAAKSQ